MIYNKKEFYTGASLLVVFFIVLFMMFQPIYHGHNAMQFLDHLYNTISKGSITYIPELMDEAGAYDAKQVTLEMTYDSEAEATQSEALFTATGAQASVSGATLKVTGSLGAILKGSLVDSEYMYNNDGDAVTAKYSLDGRRALYNWWTSLKLMDKSLKSQKEFAAAKIAGTVQTKAVEAAYNYYGVEPVQIADEMGMVAFSLIFYVIYTLWYGFAILFVFEGWGLKLSH
ncbi:MAG: hypothetical protein H0S80_05975 [Desulfovibrionaceae bacterium]|nr:hypothetical protein [Desulfovibrionaceae bacterium]